MTMTRQSKITELKTASSAMYAEYIAKRNSDAGAADYAWDMYQQLDLQLERLQQGE
jgi:hypothetical protein